MIVTHFIAPPYIIIEIPYATPKPITGADADFTNWKVTVAAKNYKEKKGQEAQMTLH